jgi:hypothetical protein
MVRAFLLPVIFASQLAVGQLASGRSPDEVVNSPIPPLEEQVQRKAAQNAVKAPVEQRILFPIPPAPRTLAKPNNVTAREDATENEKPRSPQDYLTEQTDIWNSPAMREARMFVMEFSRRSARTSPAEGEQFLQRLSALSPAKMRSWLEKYQERRLNVAVQRSIEELARRLMLEHALNRQEAMRQAAAHVSQLRAEAAEAMRMQRMAQIAAGRGMHREDVWTLDLRPVYDPMYPTLDPAMQMAEEILGVPIEQAAAAASLPGDLPRDDPRNYDRNAGDSGE